MADAVTNATGDIYYSKTVDSGVTLTDNILEPTSAVDATVTTPVSGKWVSSDVTGATSDIAVSVLTVAESEAGPAKGVTCVKIAVDAGSIVDTPGGGLIAYSSFSSASLSSYDALTFYIRVAQVSPSAGATFSTLTLKTHTVNDGATGVVETLPIPAIPITKMTLAATTDVITLASGIVDSTPPDIDRWQRVVLKLNAPSSNSALLSISLNSTAQMATATTIYIYQVRALKSFPGRTNFSISESVDSIDVSDYQSLRSKEFQPSFSTWTASIDGHKEGIPPLEKNKTYVLGFWENDTLGQCFVGNAFYTGFTPAGTFTDVVKYPYTFQGNGFLTKPLS